MPKKRSAKRQALADQVLAIIRGKDGFPISTGDVAKELGMHLTSSFTPRRWLRYRPSCWPADMADPDLSKPPESIFCDACRTFHEQPVWRSYEAQDIRDLLKRLAKEGQIEQLTMEDVRELFWRGDDSDQPIIEEP